MHRLRISNERETQAEDLRDKYHVSMWSREQKRKKKQKSWYKKALQLAGGTIWNWLLSICNWWCAQSVCTKWMVGFSQLYAHKKVVNCILFFRSFTKATWKKKREWNDKIEKRAAGLVIPLTNCQINIILWMYAADCDAKSLQILDLCSRQRNDCNKTAFPPVYLDLPILSVV